MKYSGKTITVATTAHASLLDEAVAAANTALLAALDAATAAKRLAVAVRRSGEYDGPYGGNAPDRAFLAAHAAVAAMKRLMGRLHEAR